MTFIKDCGVMIEPQEGMEAGEVVRVAQTAEKKGFGYLFRSDHLFPTSRRKGLESPECWVTMGALAAATKRIRFGTMVSPIGFRNPALLARMACTVDDLSSGRLELGVGAGWYQEEYLAHGFEFPSVEVRKAQFHEALQIIRPLTQQGRVKFSGKYFSADLDELPRNQRKVHMIIGTKSRSVARETIRYADEWNFFGSYPKFFQQTKKDLAASKREIKISQMAPFIIAEDRRSLQARVRSEMRRAGVSKDESVYERELSERGWLIATVKDFPAGVNGLREHGVEKFYYQIWQTKDAEPVDLLADVLKAM